MDHTWFLLFSCCFSSGRFTAQSLEPAGYGACRTGGPASAAAYAFTVVDALSDLDGHRTDLFTFFAADALSFIQIHTVKAEAVE